MVALINNGKVIAPHLLLNEESGKTVFRIVLPEQRHRYDPASPYWGLVSGDVWHGECNPTERAIISSFHTAPTALRPKAARRRYLA